MSAAVRGGRTPLISRARGGQSARMSRSVKVILLLVLLGLVVVPILHMFLSMTAQDFRDVIRGPRFADAVFNSLILSAVATCISVALGYLLAFCMVRTEIPWKKGFHILFTLPMLIPSISHGMGLIILFGGNGVIKNWFGWTGSIYGPVGIIVGSVMTTFPLVYLMLADVLRYQDESVYEAADVLGIGRCGQFFRITLPYLRKPLIAAAFGAFSMMITDYGVPLMIGGKTKTISLIMYEEVIGQLNFGRGCVYGLFLLLPALAAFITDAAHRERGNSSFSTRRAERRRTGWRARRAGAFAACSAVSLLALLPIAAFLVLAFASSYPRDMGFTLHHIVNTFRRGGGRYLVNSLVIALLTAVVGTVLSYITAYLTARLSSGLSRLIHLLMLTFLAIPGMVLGLSYVVTFSGTALYGTLCIMIFVNTAHFLSSPYLMMYNSFGKMNANLEAVGATLGVSRLRLIRDVMIPGSLGTIAEMFSYLFVNCMMTISAVSFLSNTFTKPIALMINQFEAQMQYECAAVVSLLILGTNLLMKILVAAIQHGLNRKKNRSTERNLNHEPDKETI